MTIDLSLSPKVRNSIAEIVSLAGIMVAALPQIAADAHVPQWTGAVLAVVVTVGNQLLKDSTIPPSLTTTPSVPTLPPASSPVAVYPPAITSTAAANSGQIVTLK